MFEDVFKLTQPAPSEAGASAAQAELGPGTRAPAPGVYNDGLLVVLGAAFGNRCFSSWADPDRVWPIAYAGLGDVFVWDRQKKIPQIISVQLAQLVPAGDSIANLFDSVLLRDEIIAAILRRDLVPELIRRYGPLKYDQYYIQEPWMMLGGDENPDKFSSGDVGVYVNLVGQTHFTG